LTRCCASVARKTLVLLALRRTFIFVGEALVPPQTVGHGEERREPAAVLLPLLGRQAHGCRQLLVVVGQRTA